MRITFILIICLTIYSSTCVEQKNNHNKDMKLIKLKEDNVVMIKGEINSVNTPKILSQLFSMKSDDIYIYLTTPGGSVIDGFQIIEAINTLKLLGKNIYCIGDIANSMGFSILQACPVRYVRPNSIIMQHQTSLAIEGPLEHIKTRFEFIGEIEKELVDSQAKRLNMSKEQFEKKILSDWWIYGGNAVAINAADELVNIFCDFDFENKTITQEIPTIFGDIIIHYSTCPLIRDPLSIDINFGYDFDKETLDNIKEKYLKFI